MANPLKLLSKLRRVDPGVKPEVYLQGEFRQNLKAIEDAFNTIGESFASNQSTTSGIESQLADLSQIPYSLYVKKTTSMPTVSPTEQDITVWESPIEESGQSIGTFNTTTGVWTCTKAATIEFKGRCGIVSNSGAEIFILAYLNSTVISAAWAQSTAARGPTVSFGRRVAIGDTIKMGVYSIGTQSMEQTSTAPIFFNIVQSGNT